MDPLPWRPDSEPYAGPGPHYIYPVEVQLDPGEPENTVDSKNLSTLPADMVIPRSLIPTGWQLVACIYDGRPTRRSGTITCHFDLGEPGTKTFPLYESQYEVVVREARNGNVVTTLDLPGTSTDEASCPTLLMYTSETVVVRGLDGDTFGAALRPAFDATR